MKLFLKIIFKDFYKIISNSNYRIFLKLVFLYGDKSRYLKDRISFLNYQIEVMDYLSFIWQFKEIFVDKVYKFKSESGSPVIYDCGANIGISCIYFKKIYPGSIIKAFEANPKAATVLSRNLEMNRINNVEVISKAVWINNNGIEMEMEDADAASIYTSGTKVKVNSIRLSEMIVDEKKIDLLKIDIEGAETEVLKDCDGKLENVENIFVEYHSFTNGSQNLDSLLNILRKNRFRFFIKPAQDRPSPFINKTNKNFPQMDLQLNIFGYRVE